MHRWSTKTLFYEIDMGEYLTTTRKCDRRSDYDSEDEAEYTSDFFPVYSGAKSYGKSKYMIG